MGQNEEVSLSYNNAHAVSTGKDPCIIGVYLHYDGMEIDRRPLYPRIFRVLHGELEGMRSETSEVR